MNETRNWRLVGIGIYCACGVVGCGGSDDAKQAPASPSAAGAQSPAGSFTSGRNDTGSGGGQAVGVTSTHLGGIGHGGTPSATTGTNGGSPQAASSTENLATGGSTSLPSSGGTSSSVSDRTPTSTSGGAAQGGTTQGSASGGALTGTSGGAAQGGATLPATGATATTAMTGGGSGYATISTVAAAPSHLTVNGQEQPLDLDVTPRFGWHVNHAEQAAYEIRVASTRAKAEAGEGDVWNSGKVVGADQSGISYLGPSLTPAERYYWVARLWAPNDQVSNWSSVGSFGTGPGSSWSSSQPIWSPADGSNWTDYTLSARITITDVALGIRFRAPDSNNGYMWQFRASDNQLAPHLLRNGSYTKLATVSLPSNTLSLGKEALIRIEANGSTLRTFINLLLVDTREDSAFASGTVGVRTGNSETGSLDDLSVVAANGQSLLQTDFSTGDRTFACGSVSSGALQIPVAAHCLTRGANAEWVFLRKEFALADKPIAWATAYATATDPKPARQYVYKLYLNGSFVGLGPTQPTADEARFDGFDVTSLVNGGQANALGVLAYTTNGQAFQAELVVEYSDGTRESLGTNKTWKGRTGDFVFPSVGSIGTGYFKAPKENLGAREFPYGFDLPGFTDDAWANAVERPALGALAAAPMGKVREQLQAPVKIVKKSEGNYFIDFGRTWVGGIEYQIDNGLVGNTVDVRFGEVTSATNTVKYQLNTGNTYQDVYTLKQGSQVFRTWGMRVFRYVEILGAPEPITAEKLKALALVYPFDPAAATLDVSDANLKRVWQLSKNTLEATNVNFYTDSWTRERANYEADAYLQQRSNLYVTDDPTLGRYAFDYFKGKRTWPTEWPLYVILGVREAWQQSGDIRQVQDQYTSLAQKLPEAWFEASTNLIRKSSGSNDCDSAKDCDIVDWPRTQRDGYVFRPYNTVINALSYRAYRDMAEMAAALGRTSDADTYTGRADALRAAINARLYSSISGSYDDGMDANGVLTGHHSLHASAFALAFGVPEAADAPRVATFIASKGMACSVYGAAFLVNALFEARKANEAITLLTSTGTSSWMNMIQAGAGATAEAWDASLKSNLTYSHPWASSPAFLVPVGLFGIRPLEPGFARFLVELRPGTLQYAAVTVPSVRGKIGAAFAYDAANTLQLAVRIPGNTKADVRIPVTSGTTALYVDGESHLVSPLNGYAGVQALGPGCHVISESPMVLALADARLLGICNQSQ